MRIYTTAETVQVEEDQRGFALRVTTVDGDDFLFDIRDVALQFAGSPGLAELLAKHERATNVRLLSDAMYSVKADLWPGQK